MAILSGEGESLLLAVMFGSTEVDHKKCHYPAFVALKSRMKERIPCKRDIPVTSLSGTQDGLVASVILGYSKDSLLR